MKPLAKIPNGAPLIYLQDTGCLVMLVGPEGPRSGHSEVNKVAQISASPASPWGSREPSTAGGWMQTPAVALSTVRPLFQRCICVFQANLGASGRLHLVMT